MTQFKTTWNAKTFPRDKETSFAPSKTIPDQAMSVKELLVRHTRGLPISGAKVPMYDAEEDDTLPDFKHMDLAELEEFRHQAKAEVLNIAQKSRNRQAYKQRAMELRDEEKSRQSKSNQGTEALETLPTDAKSRNKKTD